MRGELQPLHFPPDFFQRDAGDLFWTCVLSLQLRRMREPPLWPAHEGERYRLLVYGHWDAPVAARVEVGSSLAEGVIMEGGGDYGSDKEKRRVRRTLSATEARPRPRGSRNCGLLALAPADRPRGAGSRRHHLGHRGRSRRPIPRVRVEGLARHHGQPAIRGSLSRAGNRRGSAHSLVGRASPGLGIPFARRWPVATHRRPDASNLRIWLVEHDGIEPSTSAMPLRRSPS